jgi:hypothetical protein
VDELKQIDKTAAFPAPALNALGYARNAANWTKANLVGTPADVDETFARVRHPLSYGLGAGWRDYEPLKMMQNEDLARAAVHSGPEPFRTSEEILRENAAAGKKGPWALGRAAHLAEPSTGFPAALKSPGFSKVRALAEEASRGGWTGAGRATKYLPVGGKGLTAMFGLASLPGIIQAAKAGPVGPTGEGGLFEQGLGTLGGLAGFVLPGTRSGVLPLLGIGMGAQYLGGKLGRVLDRMRSGASVGTAVFAPSPAEARGQLENIQHYYG